jgi:DNA polymerase III subunit delta'
LLAALDRHPNARAVLEPALAPGGKPSHAYLFHGPGGAGKREIARAAAAQWLSDGAADPASARARALAGAHPDLTWVSPSGAHEILVSDIDEPVVAAASRTPFESARRLFVIERADELGDEAANRLLKTLEEPAAFVHLILITDRLPDVLPTIRSRCQVVRFDAPGADQVAAELQAAGTDPLAAAAYARLSFGDAEIARELAAPEGIELRARSQELVERVLAGELGGSPPWKGLLDAVKARGERLRLELEQRAASELELYPRKERKRVENEWAERAKRGRRRVETSALDLGLSLVAAWLLDLAALSWGADDLVRNVDRIEQLTRDAQLRSGRNGVRLSRAVELVEDTRQRFQLNVSEDLACEALTFRLQRTLAG